MTKFGVAAFAALFAFYIQPAHAVDATIISPSNPPLMEQLETYQVAQRRSCKAVSTCREAVEMWCGGYAGADRDRDGIPCENVCRSKAEVDRIKAEIGC